MVVWSSRAAGPEPERGSSTLLSRCAAQALGDSRLVAKRGQEAAFLSLSPLGCVPPVCQ